MDSLFRPQSFKEYIGQEKLIESLKIISSAAKLTNGTFSHILFYGQPGCGKTTIALLMAKHLERRIYTINGSTIKTQAEVIAILLKLQNNDILFIDEIHRLSKKNSELFYKAMEDFKIDIIIDEKINRIVELKLNKFSLIGATTNIGRLVIPFIQRFIYCFEVQLLSIEETKKLLKILMNYYKLTFKNEAIGLFVKVCEKTPRLIRNLFLKVRDYAIAHNCNLIEGGQLKVILRNLNISFTGLTSLEKRYLEVFKKFFRNDAIGIKSLSTILNEDIATLETLVEPKLITLGYIIRTKNGRILTEKALSLQGDEDEDNRF